MTVRILAFGIAREICGSARFDLEIPGDCDTAQLKELLLKHYPAFYDLASLAIAVNGEYAPMNTALKNGDEIALIPPVSGG